MKLTRIIVGAAVAVSALGFSASAAEAKAVPTINLRVPAQATAGQAFGFTYSRAAIPKGDVVLVQRQIGVTGWKTIAKVAATTGHGTVPALQLGKYWVRIAIFNKHGNGIKSVKRLVKVYGTIPLAEWCAQTNSNDGSSSNNNVFGLVWGCGNVFTVPIQGRLWTGMTIIGAETTPSIEIRSFGNTCRTMHVEFAFDEPDLAYAGTAVTITAEQTTRDPVAASTVPTELGTLDVPLDGGNFTLTTLATTVHPGGDAWKILLNGSMSCYTPIGN